MLRERENIFQFISCARPLGRKIEWQWRWGRNNFSSNLFFHHLFVFLALDQIIVARLRQNVWVWHERFAPEISSSYDEVAEFVFVFSTHAEIFVVMFFSCFRFSSAPTQLNSMSSR